MRSEVKAVMMMFLVVQLLGLLVGARLVQASQFDEELQSLNVAPGGASAEVSSSAYFIIAVVAGAVFLIVLFKFYRGVMAFRLIEAMVIFISSNIVFYMLLYGHPLAGLVSLLLAGLLTAAKLARASFKNTAAVIASAGVGAIFGFSLDLLPAVLLVIALSVYDILAVFGTKHMLVLARELDKRDMSFSVSVSGRSTKAAKPHHVPGASPDKEKPKELEEKTHLELGTGDMTIPLMLAVSSYKLFGIGGAFAVIIGSSLGLYFVLEYVFRKRTFLPALPPISFFALLALGILMVAGV
ncbi:MAG: presenilin family intramembrane aspartyl protease [Candidatus Micrarchaeota archaeon]|nr:presenilin family intramembrane aspartyl protease [Candidatus Micrarchaeota archaeon]